MMLDEITKATATLSIDPDEAHLLAAACRVAVDYALDCDPIVTPWRLWRVPLTRQSAAWRNT